MPSAIKPFSHSLWALSLLLAVSSFGATRTWTGTAGGQWTVAANWGGTAPVAGDGLVFPAGASNLNNTNDYPSGTSFAQIAIDDAGYVLNGNLVAIGPAGIITASGGTIDLPLQLTANFTDFGVTGGTLRLNGGIDLAGFSLSLFSNGGNGIADGPITGSGPAGGAIVKSGPDFWTLSGSNTFSGPVGVQAGTLFARDPSAFGTADDTEANGTFVADGGRLVFDPFVYAPERIALNGSGAGNGVLFSNGVVELTGTVVLGTDVAMNVVAGPSIRFSGIVTGSGTFGMGGGGTYILANSGNDFTGGVLWGAGGLPSTSTLRLVASNTLPSGVAIDVGAGGLFDVNGQTQTIASLAGSGNVSLGTGGNLTVTGGTTTYAGAIGGTGTIAHTGGILTLTGTSTYSGTFANVNGSTFVSAGTLPAAYTQSGGALGLSDNGTIGAVTINGGAFIPGDGGATGIGNTGSLTLAAPVLYSERILGTAAGSFGNVHVTGTVTLGGASLEVVGFGSGVAAGNTFVMIDNDGADPVIGTFAGQPEGSTISSGAGGFDYTIRYTGGTGNDVVLTAVLPASAQPIPSLDPRGLAALAVLLGVAAVVMMRR